eukprot:1147571-Pelagomonas_calceolata.AAC.6
MSGALPISKERRVDALTQYRQSNGQAGCLVKIVLIVWQVGGLHSQAFKVYKKDKLDLKEAGSSLCIIPLTLPIPLCSNCGIPFRPGPACNWIHRGIASSAQCHVCVRRLAWTYLDAGLVPPRRIHDCPLRIPASFTNESATPSTCSGIRAFAGLIMKGKEKRERGHQASPTAADCSSAQQLGSRGAPGFFHHPLYQVRTYSKNVSPHFLTILCAKVSKRSFINLQTKLVTLRMIFAPNRDRMIALHCEMIGRWLHREQLCSLRWCRQAPFKHQGVLTANKLTSVIDRMRMKPHRRSNHSFLFGQVGAGNMQGLTAGCHTSCSLVYMISRASKMTRIIQSCPCLKEEVVCLLFLAACIRIGQKANPAPPAFEGHKSPTATHIF